MAANPSHRHKIISLKTKAGKCGGMECVRVNLMKWKKILRNIRSEVEIRRQVMELILVNQSVTLREKEIETPQIIEQFFLKFRTSFWFDSLQHI